MEAVSPSSSPSLSAPAASPSEQALETASSLATLSPKEDAFSPLTTAPPTISTTSPATVATATAAKDTGGMLDESAATSATTRVVRGRYAKFTSAMDVMLLEAMRLHNPFSAKHGTRLKMWQLVAQIVGMEAMKDPGAFSWHTCRAPLFDTGTILDEVISTNHDSRIPTTLFAGHKRRRMDGEPNLSQLLSPSNLPPELDSEAFRARVLELLETKIQFDMEQRIRENDLREQELQLQRQLLAYLQSKPQDD
ncbi:hypothetical protein P43SY_006517 [Pythium insidiosum]|uniref:Uncharacterized protein n=1 Tax=Pythium insidiosum TaxID=114742 RepID=A0AAD5LIE3_PYTIN|nr:hypothetical protein P43SY_006517 [Pythium insidiosum]